MSFEENPFVVGDVVLLPVFTQMEGVITRIEIKEHPDVICTIEVAMQNPLNVHEFVFADGESFDMYFTKKES